MLSPREVAEAFSAHRFHDAYESLAPDVRWISVGGGMTEGRNAVIEVCEETLRELAGTDTQFVRFLVVDGGDAVAVDAVGRYVGADGTSTVSSCDLFEFTDGRVMTITSYAVEVPDPGI